MRRKALAFLALLSLVPTRPAAADLGIGVSGTWALRLDEADLAAGPGSDLASSYSSDAEDITLTVTGAADASDTWRVEIRREEVPWWDADLTVEIRRVGSGSGDGSVAGGTSFQALTPTDEVLFTGAGDREDIQIQLRLSGVNVGDVDPDVYLTQITYTVVDT